MFPLNPSPPLAVVKLLSCASDDRKGVFSTRISPIPLCSSGGGEWLGKLVEKNVLVGAVNGNLKMV